MKFIISFLFVVTFLSCEYSEKNSLESLQVDYIDNIPHLMFQNQLNSVFEIITYGKLNHLQKGDTLNYYSLEDKSKVRQRLRSFMCCSYVYEFDSLGLLKQMEEFTDYSEHFSFKRKRINGTIYENRDSNMGLEINYKYFNENEKITSRIGQITNHKEFSDVTHFEYNKEGQLEKKTRKRLNSLSGEFFYDKTITSYNWNKNVLKLVVTRQFHLETQTEPFYTTQTEYDSVGFPIKKTIMKAQDTIYQTMIIRH